ncbi:MAG: hypothetical protein AAFY57_15210 [Cyanobacteria bacterium J06642_2]
MKILPFAVAIAVAGYAPTIAWAGKADVIEVEVTPVGDRNYQFDVTVAHADEGWDHYADLWEVLAPDGTVLGTRILHHPHVDEQPFTRSLSVEIPPEIERVTVRAGDSVHGHGGKSVEVDIPTSPVTSSIDLGDRDELSNR